MSLFHFLLTLLVMLIWGVNFIFVKWSLDEMTPLLLCGLRFLLASIPAIFFIKRPAIPIHRIALYGLVMFALQFSFLFIGMRAGMSPGMAAILMQVQVFFTLFFAAIFLGERPAIWQIIGALISFTGIGLVGVHLDNQISLIGFICILAATIAWAWGNLILKQFKQVNMLSLIVWGSLIASIPMMCLSLLIEGPQTIIKSYTHLTWLGGLSLLYIVYLSTWVGYGLWGWLIGRYAVGTIVPFTLLVPVIAMSSSALLLGEIFEWWKLAAALLVMGGLGLNLLGTQFMTRKKIIPQPQLNMDTLVQETKS